MAKQRTKTMEEQLEEMKAQLAKNQQELEAKKDELGTYSAACDPESEIACRAAHDKAHPTAKRAGREGQERLCAAGCNAVNRPRGKIPTPSRA
jgi:glutamate/tyrosine decarboxylase-like PLP-dependent enzyme